jgi:hypothetical protein
MWWLTVGCDNPNGPVSLQPHAAAPGIETSVLTRRSRDGSAMTLRMPTNGAA